LKDQSRKCKQTEADCRAFKEDTFKHLPLLSGSPIIFVELMENVNRRQLALVT
jgi:hypothetical protein